MSERALELLALPDDQSCYLLDLGCGSGIQHKGREEELITLLKLQFFYFGPTFLQSDLVERDFGY